MESETSPDKLQNFSPYRLNSSQEVIREGSAHLTQSCRDDRARRPANLLTNT